MFMWSDITQTQQIRTFFAQEYIFSSKNLRICIFCCTFAADFEKRVFCMRWRDGRVVDCGGLENRWAERLRGFESLSLRKNKMKNESDRARFFMPYGEPNLFENTIGDKKKKGCSGNFFILSCIGCPWQRQEQQRNQLQLEKKRIHYASDSMHFWKKMRVYLCICIFCSTFAGDFIKIVLDNAFEYLKIENSSRTCHRG